MQDLPPLVQYMILGLVALVATVVVLWLYNRREQRRRHALELARLMNQWGMSWFAEAYECYAVGDYSGLAWKIKEVISAVRTDEAMVAKLWDVATKVTTYVAANDQTKADELRKILGRESAKVIG
ncbi:MAG: hypothetical protein JW888_06790 [Pirellulales bacterium]|nr:hypothetical protein [Pirellulales bacterium]